MHANDNDKLEVLILREGLCTVFDKLERIERLIRAGDRAELAAITKVLEEIGTSASDAEIKRRINLATARLNALGQPTTPVS